MLVPVSDWIGLLSGRYSVHWNQIYKRLDLSMGMLNGCVFIFGTGFQCLEAI
jgi:hypothetical protein